MRTIFHVCYAENVAIKQNKTPCWNDVPLLTSLVINDLVYKAKTKKTLSTKAKRF